MYVESYKYSIQNGAAVIIRQTKNRNNLLYVLFIGTVLYVCMFVDSNVFV